MSEKAKTVIKFPMSREATLRIYEQILKAFHERWVKK